MAFVRLAHFPGGDRTHVDALTAAMGDLADPPERLVFAAGPVAGGWQVVQVWTDRAALDRFNAEHVLPALRRVGDRGFPAPPQVTDFETEQLAFGLPPAPEPR